MLHQTARAGLRAARLGTSSAASSLTRQPIARSSLARSAVAAAAVAVAPRSRIAGFHTSPAAREPEKDDSSEPPAAGSYARTDESITVEYPEDHELPSSTPVEGAGRAGVNVLPTLAAFSLQGKVGLVTGGARGLGLVMGQGMVISGADLAIVDLNSMFSSSPSRLAGAGGGGGC